MNVILPKDLTAFVDELMKTGHYDFPGEVIQHALWVLKAHLAVQDAQQEELRKLIQVGIDSADRGELLDGKEVFAKVLARIRHQEEVARTSLFASS